MQRLSTARENALHAWIQAILTGVTVIWEHEGGQRPNAPFASLDIIAGPQSTGPGEQRWDAEDTFAHALRKLATLSVSTFGDNALVMAVAVEDALQLPTHQTTLRQAGFAVWGHDGPRDITALMDTQHEGRAVIDIFIAWAEAATDTPGEIHKVGISSGVCDQTITIEVE
ncbi:hypothetical protein DSCW_18180 [Desulfosarcina widdelii]|uniref:Phage neck terminator protein gp12-like domain-containing protein n=1 Tax=Desulfosarcina widdelii TaxID=947919 RepID=A0A5K7Z492_9BACT|nr:hypothetical protein [Desulfosarcina widdelii]BBO74401.1 hypothetical protein DSCW_18180 [Desulfosarcina widdelii]